VRGNGRSRSKPGPTEFSREFSAWRAKCFSQSMKRAEFKVLPSKGGWIRTTIAPINDKHADTFGLTDVLMFSALVLAVIAVARVLIAH
jgi:hypothetical protein